ncbi:MAG TPA: polysaccharide pyruvyl transferase family protein [Rhodospirillales bacterium]|nr:polysaccharide pyruvyl transferase family protein [Rhodospirillales bacterium]
MLFSTTRMYNPGDDFVLFGIRRLLEASLGSFVPVVHNRNPALHALRGLAAASAGRTDPAALGMAELHRAIEGTVPAYDNSWHAGFDMDAVDLAVFAGTPEWAGTVTAPLADALLTAGTPTLYLGLGAFEGVGAMGYAEIPKRDRRLLEGALLVTVRDEACAALLAPLSPALLPCPSLFAAPQPRPRARVRRIALSMQGVGERNPQRIERETFAYAEALFVALAERFECTLVCHYIDEIAELRAAFGDGFPISYAYDAAEYLEIYDGFDVTVTTRVHGAGLAASLGIPGFLIGHSARAATAEGFCATILDPNEWSVDAALDLIASYDAAASKALIAHKEAAREATLGHLRPALRDLGFAE